MVFKKTIPNAMFNIDSIGCTVCASHFLHASCKGKRSVCFMIMKDLTLFPATLHERYRLHPDGLNKAQRAQLKNTALRWLCR